MITIISFLYSFLSFSAMHLDELLRWAAKDSLVWRDTFHIPDEQGWAREHECLTIFASNIQKIYIDPEWVAQGYLRRCKAGAWKAGNDMDSLNCWNLERIIDAEMYGNTKTRMLTMEEFLSESEGMDVDI